MKRHKNLSPLAVLVFLLVSVTCASFNQAGAAPPATPKSVFVRCDSLMLTGPGSKTQCHAIVTLADDKTQDQTTSATWSSSNELVATVAPGGIVTSGAPGGALITATLGKLSGSRMIAVVQAGAAVRVSMGPLA